MRFHAHGSGAPPLMPALALGPRRGQMKGGAVRAKRCRLRRSFAVASAHPTDAGAPGARAAARRLLLRAEMGWAARARVRERRGGRERRHSKPARSAARALLP